MSAAHRLQVLESPLGDAAQDIVIVSACRTPICRARRGGLRDTDPTDLLATVLKAVVARVPLSCQHIEDVVVGNVLLPGAGALQARMAMLLAGYAPETSIHTLNRQCSSGLQAIASIAASIKAGHIGIGVAAGLESMSMGKMGDVGPISERVMAHDLAKQCTLTMGATSEIVAERYRIPRNLQDRFAVASFTKAVTAQHAGHFAKEIVPVLTSVKDETGRKVPLTVTQDDGPRHTTYDTLAKLKPAFQADGRSTAGNSSQVSDGAAAVILTTRATAARLGLPVLAVLRGYATAGCRPDEMGVGPVFAIPKALQKAGLTIPDIDVFEINEAFASQCLYCMQKLNIPLEKVNPVGGAIALGHPLGCTGCRQVVTLVHELHRRGRGKGVVSMCVGTGMGAAAVFEVE